MRCLLPILSFFIIAAPAAYPCSNHDKPASKEQHDAWAASAMSKDFFSGPSSQTTSAIGTRTPAARRPTSFEPSQASFGGPQNQGVPVRGVGAQGARTVNTGPPDCKWGKACGGTCISRLATCETSSSRGFGVAQAQEAPACQKTCWRGKACGDECISRLGTCNKPRGTACNP